MSGREWKPGDVVLATVRGVPGQIVMRRNDPDITWLSCEHPGGTCHHNEAHVTDLRPLAVIDYEDREQVERLLTLLRAQNHAPDTADIMQAALREFANPTPPKPDEPTGLGAVVEDSDGQRFVRYRPIDGPGHYWTNSETGSAAKWSEIAAVKVLNAGWSA